MGKQELGETVAQCAIRETLEETGVTVEVTGLLDIYSDPAHIVAYTDGEVRQEYEVILLGRPVSGEPTANDEASAAGWFTRGNCSSWTSTRRSGGSSATGWTGRTRASTSALRSARLLRI
jgi:ADP-ribose pyrophosphatase YjhB (NUDIX family)